MRPGYAAKLCMLGAIGLLSACGTDSASSTFTVSGPPPASAPVPAATAGQAAPQPMMPASTLAGTGGMGMAPPMTPPPVVPVDDAMWCGVKLTLDSNCIACHDGQRTAGAPMSLKSYDDLLAPAVSDASKKVYQLVGVRVHDTVRPMPPQQRLTAEQLDGIDAWVAAGAPTGSDPACPGNAPPTQPEEPGWPDNCDDTYRVLVSDSGGRPGTVGPATEAHPQFPITAPWGSEEVQAIAWRAITDNARVLHHWILYGPSREFLFGWAPGKDSNEDLPPDVGMYLPSGRLSLDVHYNNVTGTEMESDESGFELCVLKRPNFRPKTATVTMGLSQFLISVPPGATNFDVTGTCTHSGAPVNLLSVNPHAHRTAKHMKFTLEKADGETIVMHDMPFNFEEQTNFALDPPVVVEAGDRIVTTCTYNNDTDRTITFGENTGNEMCFNFAIYEPMGGLSCGAGGGFPRF